MVTLGLVVAEFNAPITEQMADAAHEAATERGADVVAEVSVPGSYDTPLAADRLARRDDIEAVAVLGTIITGDTGHDNVIGHATAQALNDVSLGRDVPVTLGVSGPDQSADEARARIAYATRAVEGAIDMVEALA